MKALLLAIMIVISSAACFSQEKKKDNVRNCADIMDELSYYWKLDSLPSNGFRFYTYRMFLNCNIGKVDKKTLLSKLGRPTSIQETNHGYEYRYYYFDINHMPKGYDAPLACWYVSFNFKLDHKYVYEIKIGDIER